MALELRQYIRSKKRFPIIEEIINERKIPTASGRMKIKLEKWVRIGKPARRGVLVSNGADSVGWSLVNPRDVFDLKEGLRLARIHEKEGEKFPVPPSIAKEVKKMLERSRKYFKP